MEWLKKNWVVLLIVIIVVAALFWALKGNFGAHVGALGQTASVQVGGA